MGKVVDIVFAPGHNPNNGDFPLYIIVSFPQCNGPSFFPDQPNWVPLVFIESRCKFGCCSSKYFPLQLCSAKTVHTFQGQNSGPVSPGQQLPNSIHRIICNPGDRSFEAKNQGLLYTIEGRASTLGNPKNKMSSALYFTGEHMKPDRILNIAKGAIGKLFRKVFLRNQWVEFLNQHLRSSGLSSKNKQSLFIWANSTVIISSVYNKLTLH
jgi:hypothetical protein